MAVAAAAAGRCVSADLILSMRYVKEDVQLGCFFSASWHTLRISQERLSAATASCLLLLSSQPAR